MTNIFKGIGLLGIIILGVLGYVAWMSYENKRRIAAINKAVNGSAAAKSTDGEVTL